MTYVLIVLLAQGVLSLLEAHGRRGPTSGLDASREAILALVFVTVGTLDWTGMWAAVLGALLLLQAVLTLERFTEPAADTTSPGERMLGALSILGLGLTLAAWAPALLRWGRRPMGFAAADHGVLGWTVTALGLAMLARAVRDTRAVVGTLPVVAAGRWPDG